MTDHSPMESFKGFSRRYYTLIGSQKVFVDFFLFCLLLILRFGDEVRPSLSGMALRLRPVRQYLGQHIPSAWLLAPD